MVDLDDVVQVLDPSAHGILMALTLFLQLGEGRGIGRRLVRVDYLRLLPALQAAQRFAAVVFRIGER